MKRRTDTYAGREKGWLTSRLQMYWNTHATDVYIKGEVYDHASGNRAPAPTVMFTGARSHATTLDRVFTIGGTGGFIDISPDEDELPF